MSNKSCRLSVHLIRRWKLNSCFDTVPGKGEMAVVFGVSRSVAGLEHTVAGFSRFFEPMHQN